MASAFTTVANSQVPQLIADAAARYGVPSQLAMEVAIQESGLIQTAISSAGAIGVMQLEPATAAQYGANPYDTAQNIDAGVHYLADLLAEFGGDQAKALAAYNAGPGAVNSAINSSGANWLSALPSETQNYVPSILSASGSAYTPSITPASAAAGASQTFAGALKNIPWSTVLLLTAAAVGAYLAGELLAEFTD